MYDITRAENSRMLYRIAEYLTPGRLFFNKDKDGLLPASAKIEFWSVRLGTKRVFISGVTGKETTSFDKDYYLFDTVEYSSREEAAELLTVIRQALAGTKQELDF